MIITLAALNAGIIDLANAAAVAIGADLGTTTTVMLGAIRGSRTKQQVAAGHVLFNVVTDALAYILLVPMLALIAIIGIDDPLYALVAFHSLFNLLGLIIFMPLTGPFARQLERLLPEHETHEARYLTEVSEGVGEAAVEAIERETSLLIARTVQLCMIAFDPRLPAPAGTPPMPHRRGIGEHLQRPFDELYAATKTLEGELLKFTIRLQAGTLDDRQSERLNQLLSAAREAIHSAKAIKNIRHNLLELAGPASAIPALYADQFRTAMQEFIAELFQLHGTNEKEIMFEDLAIVLRRANRRHDKLHDTIYAGVHNDSISRSQVSSLLNVIRETHTSNQSLIYALGNYFLDAAEAENLERIPD
jgi:phosphate:Na+ symporter